MKVVLLSIIFFLSILAGFGQDIKALDEKYGFREAKFETPLASFKNLVEIELNSHYYSSPTENLKIWEYDLYSINYIFYKVYYFNKLQEIRKTKRS